MIRPDNFTRIDRRASSDALTLNPYDPYDSMEPVAFNGWWVAGATCLFASSPVFWVAVLASPDWLRNTILSAAAMLALGLIVFGLVMSFLDGLDDSVSELRDVLS